MAIKTSEQHICIKTTPLVKNIFASSLLYAFLHSCDYYNISNFNTGITPNILL